jgi:hypothetical protein
VTPARKTPPPYGFVLDVLAPREPVMRPMFGCYALYCGGRITLVLRKRRDHPSMNGVWVATTKEHHASLRRLLPCLRSIPLLGKGETNWQMIPESDEEFERAVLAACDLVLRRDRRIGTVPKERRAARG